MLSTILDILLYSERAWKVELFPYKVVPEPQLSDVIMDHWKLYVLYSVITEREYAAQRAPGNVKTELNQ